MTELRSEFADRHIGPNKTDINSMLKTLNLKSLDHLIESAAPHQILTQSALDIGQALSEEELILKAKSLAQKNKVLKSMIGLGYYGTVTPKVILRNILENPGWYTAYTPYQAEISQGRMEALLNFQTMVADFTGMEISNASLLDEGTAAAEAMVLAKTVNRKSKSNKFFVSNQCLPQTIEVLETRAEPLEIELIIGDAKTFDFSQDVFGCLLQYPGKEGVVENYEAFTEKAHSNNALVIAATDIMSLALLKAPGEWGADAVVGSTQRFGVPMGFGGPHAAFLATKDAHKRSMPGRIIGLSKDADGNPALRLALQTREQHIRREKATSNICTAQVLLAVMASMYAVYHGPKGVKNIAKKIHGYTQLLANALTANGLKLKHNSYFDTLAISTSDAKTLVNNALKAGFNIAILDDSTVGIAIDEATTREDLFQVCKAITGKNVSDLLEADLPATTAFSSLDRTSEYLTHPTFNQYHSETEMLRYISRLEKKDLSLNHSMIPLGSCTMKLNATTEMIPVTWPEFSNMHPFVPSDQAEGSITLIKELEKWICDITGFAASTMQPNAGSQGEYAGLLVIRKYHQENGQAHRNICLIPSSAHGTNPASAVMAGMQVVVVGCDNEGNIDIADLKNKAEAHKNDLAALMVTYPSTHGVFEEGIKEICEIIHSNGGQVYMDGANLNALVGIAKPGEFGPDVCHLNLHKTFCIPHGGGGPGVGPIAVAAHLANYLPTHSLNTDCGPKQGVKAVSAAPWGSASILPISWAYIAMMGSHGLKKATQVAILNANYIAKKLEKHYPILYKAKSGHVAHECIIDTRMFKDTADISVDDIAKRLMDFGFHAPTMSWPVPGTLMIEPTESESLEELDRFCDAMIQIRNEIKEIEEGNADKANNVLKNAPHSIERITADTWDYPYSRQKAAYPSQWVRERKFWVPVSRVDNVYGDRNLVCSCPSIESYQ